MTSHNGAKVTAEDQNPGLGVRLGHSKVWRPQKVARCSYSKVPLALRFEQRSPRYGQTTVLAHNEPYSPQWGHGDNQGPKLGSKGAFGPFGVCKPKVEGLVWGKVPWGWRFEPCSPRYGQITDLGEPKNRV